MYDGHMEVVGELLPGLIRLGAITSDHFDDSIHGLVVIGFATEQFLGAARMLLESFLRILHHVGGYGGKSGNKKLCEIGETELW